MIGCFASPNEKRALGGVSREMVGAAWTDETSKPQSAASGMTKYLFFMVGRKFLRRESWLKRRGGTGCVG
jgi:hypothetical protein